MYESKEKSLATILMENDGAKDRRRHGCCCEKDFCNSNNSTTKIEAIGGPQQHERMISKMSVFIDHTVL